MRKFELTVKYIDLCVKYGLFTCGNIRQYQEAQKIAEEIIDSEGFLNVIPFNRLCAITWICSDTCKFEYCDVEIILLEMLD